MVSADMNHPHYDPPECLTPHLSEQDTLALDLSLMDTIRQDLAFKHHPGPATPLTVAQSVLLNIRAMGLAVVVQDDIEALVNNAQQHFDITNYNIPPGFTDRYLADRERIFGA